MGQYPYPSATPPSLSATEASTATDAAIRINNRLRGVRDTAVSIRLALFGPEPSPGVEGVSAPRGPMQGLFPTLGAETNEADGLLRDLEHDLNAIAQRVGAVPANIAVAGSAFR